jgi:hypothetical protein
MTRRNLRIWAIASVLAGVLVLPSSAFASSATIGSTFSGANNCCNPPVTFIVQSTAATSPHYVVPVGGTKITAFRMQGNLNGGGQVELKVFRKTATAGTWKVIGQSAPETLSASVLNTFSTAIPVRAGDVLGLTAVSGSGEPIFGSGFASGDVLNLAPGNPAPGSNYSPTTPSPPGYRLNVAAVVQLQPTVTNVSGSSGSHLGGTSVTITGTHFLGTKLVEFGTTKAASFTVVSDTKITAVTPAHAVGTVDVRVSTAGGLSPISVADHFTFT